MVSDSLNFVKIWKEKHQPNQMNLLKAAKFSKVPESKGSPGLTKDFQKKQ